MGTQGTKWGIAAAAIDQQGIVSAWFGDEGWVFMLALHQHNPFHEGFAASYPCWPLP